MIVKLSRTYTGRYGTPTLDRVETDIFVHSWHGSCMECSFCHDICCQYGATLGSERLQAIEAIADQLEPYLGIPRDRWFRADYDEEDPEYEGGRRRRTTVVNGICVFAHPQGRGCRLHSFALENQIDVHDIKPMPCLMFPIYWLDGLLHPNDEVLDGSLVCLGRGKSVYRGSRDEVLYYFGPELVAELDGLEREALRELPASHPAVEGRLIPLPLIAN
ncbi:MAG: hypothetical protein JNM56_39890 [Planctomycetia bacterium]|nr:hypothetical protein [Planctomycetia bacterium]